MNIERIRNEKLYVEFIKINDTYRCTITFKWNPNPPAPVVLNLTANPFVYSNVNQLVITVVIHNVEININSTISIPIPLNIQDDENLYDCIIDIMNHHRKFVGLSPDHDLLLTRLKEIQRVTPDK